MSAGHSLQPRPAEITPQMLSQHGITAEEYQRILSALGRTPSLTELGIYSVMWSEHCSYKSSRVHLKRLPTKSDRVVQGPGENAGIIDVGDGWACAFKIESHNHPSYIEPYQGAATGVGGILRDIFTMGARPLAVMDSLRFGPLTEESMSSRPESAKATDLSSRAEPRSGEVEGSAVPAAESIARKNQSILQGVVHGIAGYGNCFGVPNLGGETRFEPCYSGNPLVNAFALGLVRIDEIFYAKASGIGNPVIYVGAKTGRDGIHGATMASEEFKEGSEQKRPNVQMGNPFMEKLLLEACLEVMHIPGAVVGIQDMGAAGLTCSTCEMGARGGVGLDVELDNVPQRETGMSGYEIMLSESQERMLLVAEKGREQEVLDVFFKWGLDANIVGMVIPEPRMRIHHHGVLIADIPNQSLTDDAPLYHRPVGTWKAPLPLDPPPHILEELKKPRDYTADLKKLLASPNICSKRWVYEHYDSMVQTNTVQGPGGEAGVMRIKGTGTREQGSETKDAGAPGSAASSPNLGTSSQRVGESGAPGLASETWVKPERGLAMALAGNSRWCYLDPKLGAMHAVAEAARKIACTGATPVAATNCLNFGTPEKPEIMAQLSAAIDGIAEACTALGTPITGGNVSLYNETRGEGIYPTPVIGVVGILEDVTKAVPASFQHAGDAVLLLSVLDGVGRNAERDFGSTEYAKAVIGHLWGTPSALNITKEASLHRCLAALAEQQLIHSACDISDGGAFTTMAEAGFEHGIGLCIEQKLPSDDPWMIKERLFSEMPSSVILTADPANVEKIKALVQKFEFVWVVPLATTNNGDFEVFFNGRQIINTTIRDLKSIYSNALESQLAAEVLA